MNNKTPFVVGEEPAPQMHSLDSVYSQLGLQVNAAFEKLDCGKAKFISHEQARSEMAERKTRIRNNG